MASLCIASPILVSPNSLVLAQSRGGCVGSGCHSLEWWTFHLSLALRAEGWSTGCNKPPRSKRCFLDSPATQSVPLSFSVLHKVALLAGSRLWSAHISKQMAPGAHNCCQTCVDFNSPFSLALCEITCLCVVTQLNCQLWWLSLAFTTISGNHQYYLWGWTKEKKISLEVQVTISASAREAAFFSGLNQTWVELSFPIRILGQLTQLTLSSLYILSSKGPLVPFLVHLSTVDTIAN